MKKTIFVFATAFLLSQGASAESISESVKNDFLKRTATCETQWNESTKNDKGEAVAHEFNMDAKLKMVQRPIEKVLNKEEWMKVCKKNLTLGHRTKPMINLTNKPSQEIAKPMKAPSFLTGIPK